MASLDDTTLILKITLHPGAKADFLNWQSRFRSQISQAQGFTSLEILSPYSPQSNTWILHLRFNSKDDLDVWLKSPLYTQLLKELTDCGMIDTTHAISQEKPTCEQSGVTEIYVTSVNNEKLPEFHEWHEKIHKIESTFPGFQKVYVQAPNSQNGTWITLLQFDTLGNLEQWLNSPQRAAILKESQDFVTTKETHRLLSSFGGWFTDRSLAETPPRWKQAMLILVVLFPIVMTQFLYLSPYLGSLTLSVRTFIENSTCVTLMTWPMLPIAIYALKWWLELKNNLPKQLLGIGILFLVYAFEVALFWSLSNI